MLGLLLFTERNFLSEAMAPTQHSAAPEEALCIPIDYRAATLEAQSHRILGCDSARWSVEESANLHRLRGGTWIEAGAWFRLRAA